jgi:hypothetical protein
MQWDPLSNTYLLVTYADGFMSVLDTDSGSVVTDFPRATVDVSMGLWIRNVPGTFATVNERSPVITMWNVSQKYGLCAATWSVPACPRPALTVPVSCAVQDAD